VCRSGGMSLLSASFAIIWKHTTSRTYPSLNSAHLCRGVLTTLRVSSRKSAVYRLMPIWKASGYSVHESCLHLVRMWLKRRWLSATQTRVISRIDFAGIRELLRASIETQRAEFGKMIVRLWTARVKKDRIAEYEENERTRSAPMFRRQPGCLGVMFLRSGENCCALTFWKDLESVEALKTSTSYLEAAAFYSNSGMLLGDPSLEVFDVSGGFLDIEALAHAKLSVEP